MEEAYIDEDEWLEKPDIVKERNLVLKVPPSLADRIRSKIRTARFSDSVSLKFNDDCRTGSFYFENETYPMTLVDLPSIVEVQKTFDKRSYFKGSDVGQMIVVDDISSNGENQKKHESIDFNWPHGLAPPQHDIRKKRIRKKGFAEKPLKVDVQRVSDRLQQLLEEDVLVDYEVQFVPEEEIPAALPKKAAHKPKSQGTGSTSGKGRNRNNKKVDLDEYEEEDEDDEDEEIEETEESEVSFESDGSTSDSD